MTSNKPPEHMRLWDAVSLIVGIVVGTAIFAMPPQIFGLVGTWQGMACWVAGGVFALVGALCYAELAVNYPGSGGDYIYLTRAYGRGTGFLFGWIHLLVILPCNIGAMAYIFALYGRNFLQQTPIGETSEEIGAVLAAAATVVLTAINLLGVAAGKWTQNGLTLLKVVGLAAVAAAGFGYGGDVPLTPAKPIESPGWGLAMVFVMYTYGGWNDSAFVASEVRDRKRDIPRALLLGVGGIMALYLVLNAAYLWGLGYEGLTASQAPAADVLQKAWGPKAAAMMSVLVMLSALGAMNGLIFTGSRLYVGLGADHALFAKLGAWSGRRRAPIAALVSQCLLTLALIAAVGSKTGRDAIDAVFSPIFGNGLPWEQYYGGFDTLVAASAPLFWLFFALTCGALLLLRIREGLPAKHFAAPFFPLEPLVFGGVCLYMLYSAISYAQLMALLGLAPLLLGVALYAGFSRRPLDASRSEQENQG